jgi:protein TonB
MRLGSRTTLYVLSLGAHGALGAFLGTIPTAKSHETVAISFTETKAKAPAPAQLPPEPEPPVKPAAPVRAKAAPPAAAKPAAQVANANTTPGLDALPDFGLSLGGGSGGLAIAAAGPAAAPTSVAVTKTLTPAAVPKRDDCTEPPVKAKVLSRPTPAFTAEARVAGVSGKVRVEIVVDEHGRVVSVRVLEGLGHGLDEAALAAARAMTFEAATRCGKPTTATFKVGFTFSP